MIRLQDIISQYPPKLHGFPKAILREYLQYKILAIIFSHPLSQKLCFIGGTALRIGYQSQRFSEDIDFDNRGLTETEFEEITGLVQKELCGEGYAVEIRHVYKGAFHCTIKIPQILFDNDLAYMASEKLTIKIDTTSQGYRYEPQIAVLQGFGIVSPYALVPKNILFSMKLSALFGRVKGRDLFDLVFLLGLNEQPHWGFCEFAFGISDPDALKKAILERVAGFNLQELQRDVQPFLFNSNDQSVILFPRLIETTQRK